MYGHRRVSVASIVSRFTCTGIAVGSSSATAVIVALPEAS
jgi:hypothetical protein